MTPTLVTVANDELETLLNIEEGHFVDLKAVEIAPASVTSQVSAFANTSGGELFIGIDERLGAKGKERVWRGFQDQEAANGLVQAIEKMSPLGNHYALEFLQSDSQPGLVAHLTVFKSKDILLASNGKIYVRRGAQKLPVEGEEALKRLRLDKGVVSFEDELIDAKTDALSNSLTMIDFMLDVVPNAEPEDWLSKQRLISGGRPIVAGVLLFADEPQSFLPKRSAVKILRYKTKAEGERDTLASDPVTIEGSIYDLIFASVAAHSQCLFKNAEFRAEQWLMPFVDGVPRRWRKCL
jgi:ATP-dependent DNA helicase RecG